MTTSLLPAALLLATVAALVPPPGTRARGREFCRAWLALEPVRQLEALREADAREARSERERECRERLRARARDVLESECRGWTSLMDFEVRAILDRVHAACAAEGAGATGGL
jgi:hypothetical protein